MEANILIKSTQIQLHPHNTIFLISLNLSFRLAAAEYAKILAQRQKEAKEAKELKRRRLVGEISSPSCRIILIYD